MALLTLEKAAEILGLQTESVRRLKRDGALFGWDGKYDESSVYNYKILKEYSDKNGKDALIDRTKKRAPKMPKKRGKYKK